MGLWVNTPWASWQPVKGFWVNTPWAGWTPVKVASAKNLVGSWSPFYTATTPLAASSPGGHGFCSNGQPNNSPCTATATATVAATGGSGSYTYSWSFVSGNSNVALISGASAATATFQETANASNQTVNAVYKCVVSDGASSVTVNPINISLEFDNTV